MSDLANEMTGGEALARMLQAHGVGPDVRHGRLPAAAVLRCHAPARPAALPDQRRALRRFRRRRLRRVTGRVGVCDATLGPGATNLVTALVESLNAGTPLVAIVGDTHRGHAWKNMTQESRQLEILRPAVKEVLRIEAIGAHSRADPPRVHWSRPAAGPGPWWSTCPRTSPTTTMASRTTSWLRMRPTRPSRPCAAGPMRARSRPRASFSRARKAADPSVRAAACICRTPPRSCRRFAEAFAIPVAHTLSGKGAIACTHPLSAGHLRTLHADRQRSDRGVGLHPGGRLQARRDRDQALHLPPPGRTLIHLDIVAEEIGRCYPADHRALGRRPRRPRGSARAPLPTAPSRQRR